MGESSRCNSPLWGAEGTAGGPASRLERAWCVWGGLPGGQAWSVGEGALGLVKRFVLGAMWSPKSDEHGRQVPEASALAFLQRPPLHWTVPSPLWPSARPPAAHPPCSAPTRAARLWGQIWVELALRPGTKLSSSQGLSFFLCQTNMPHPSG